MKPYIAVVVALMLCTAAPTLAPAQEVKGTSQRDVTARIRAAYALLGKGDVTNGYARLVEALKAGDDSGQFSLAIREYTTAAQSFANVNDNATADALYKAALKTKAVQRGGRDAAMLWFNYGWFLNKANQTERALPIAHEAHRRMRQAFGPSSVEDIAGSDLLSALLVNNGQVASGLNTAEQIYNDARKALGDAEPLTWRTANNYAEALRMVGHPEASIVIDEPLLRNRIRRYGLGSIQALVSSSNVALNHLAMGNEAATMQALDVQRKSAVALADPRSEHVAQADTWIAYAKAIFHPDIPLSDEALARMARVKDWNGAPDLLRIKTAQLAADRYEQRGDSERAMALRIDAYNRSRTTIAAAHPITFDALLGIAMLRMRRGDADTLATFQDLEQQLFRWMLREVGTAGNRFVADTTRKLADDILAEFGRFAFATPAAAPAYADAVSRWKTMEDGERTRLRLAADTLPDEDTRALARKVIRLSGQQQELLSSGKIDDDARQVLAELQNARTALTARLDDGGLKFKAASIEDHLRPTEALVDFFASGRRGKLGATGASTEMRLQAVIRRHNASPALVDLGPLASLLAVDASASDQAQTFRRIHDALIGPLKPHIKGVERLYIVPDAELYSVPFAMLQDADGKYLDEIYNLHLLTRADALFFTERNTRLSDASNVLLVGGLDYNGAVNQLPSTREEIERIDTDLKQARLDTTIIGGSAGRETAIRKAAQGTSLIHFATHGFFKSATDRTDALWRSGLVMSAPDFGSQKRRDDGVLYAQELMDWDLSAANLVVLSACQTAQGDPSRIGSARGLPTALAIAGARRSLLTLWEVNDEGAANFMTRFYQLLTTEKLDYATALRRTRIEAIHGRIANAADPSLWAAFVLFES